MIEPGSILCGANKRWTAKVPADGSVITANLKGSIHQATPACNGRQFWNIDVQGKLVSIDALRQKLRAELN